MTEQRTIEERVCGACGRPIPPGGSLYCGTEHAPEHRTSNPILDELRAEVRALRSFPVAISALSCIDVFTKAADEIERLTAELAAARAQIYDQRTSLSIVLDKERDRLRAALEEIDKATLAKDAELAMWVIRSKARSALAGAVEGR